METILLSNLQAGVKIGGRLVLAVDFQEIWVKIYFDSGNPLLMKNMDKSTVAVEYPVIDCNLGQQPNKSLQLTPDLGSLQRTWAA